MGKKVLLVATVQSHIGQFHKPLMKLLKEAGWEVHVAARNNLAEKNGLTLDYPDKVFDIPFRRMPYDPRNAKAYRQLKQILKAEQYDVIHCNTPVGGVLGRLAAIPYRKHGTRVLYTAHGFHFYKGAPLKNWILYYPIEKLLSRCTDTLITINREDFMLAQAKFHCPVYHQHGVGANSTKFHPLSAEEQKRRREELGFHGPLIVNVGELLPNKNQKTAVSVVASLVKAYPNLKLLIAGNGPEKANLEAQIASSGLQNNVTLLGYTTQLETYLQICDLLIACSYREGLPLNVMEAMLCGKPVIASRNRGHNELVRDGENGFLVHPDDVSAYAEKICSLLRENRDFTSAATNSVEAYTDRNVQEELISLYHL